MNNTIDTLKTKHEMLQYAYEAFDHLKLAKKHLTTAESLGPVHIIIGGFFTTTVNHSRIDDALAQIHLAKNSLTLLRYMWYTLEYPLDFDMHFNKLWAYTNYFCDNNFGDLLNPQDELSLTQKLTYSIQLLYEIIQYLETDS